MTTTKNEQVTSALAAIGIPAKAYAKGPMGKYNVCMRKNAQGTGLMIWIPETADFTLILPKKKDQKYALIKVREGERTFGDILEYYNSRGWSNASREQTDKLGQFPSRHSSAKEYETFYTKLRKAKLGHFGVATGTSSQNDKFEPDFSKTTVEQGGEIIRYRGKRTTQATPYQYLLVGIDESKTFISFLKGKPSTVTGALRTLIPEGLDVKTSVRQGEWFFTPITDPVLEKGLTVRGLKGHSRTNRTLENQSSHVSEVFMDYGGQNYVWGKITDTRKGYHHPLNLDGWHLVTRNNEIKTDPYVRYYD